MFILYFGNDTYTSYKTLQTDVSRFKKQRDPHGYNVDVFDFNLDKNLNDNEIFNLILASPFLGEKRLVVFKNLLIKGSAKFKQKLLEKIKNNQIPKTSILFFWEDNSLLKTNRNNKPDLKFKNKTDNELLVFLKQQKYTREFKLPNNWQLKQKIIKDFQTNNINFEAQALDYLLANKSDLQQMYLIIDQVLAFNNYNKFDLKTLKYFLPPIIEDNIFDLIDSIINKNLAKTYKMIRDQYKVKEDEQFIFVMLFRQIKILLQVKELKQQFGAQANLMELAKKINIHHYSFKLAWQQVDRFSLDRLKMMYKTLLQTDIRVKTQAGLADYKTLIDLLVTKIAN